MQLTIKHEAKGLTLPLSHHSILQGIIYNNLRSMASYSGYLHNQGYEFENRAYKMFTFSEIKGKGKVANKMITFNGNIEWSVHSIDPFFIHTLKENLERNGITYGKVHFQNVECICSNKTVEQEMIYIKMKSPIVSYITNEDKKTDYYTPNQEEFYYSILTNFERKYESCFFEKVENEIQIAPVSITPKDKTITWFKGTIIEGYKGIYALKGPRKYLDFLYQVGLGSKNSQGFGLFEVME